MGRKKHKTDEEIMELVNQYEYVGELRADNLALYQLARRKGLLDNKKSKFFTRKDTDKIIEWIKTFNRRADIRAANNSLYTWCLRNGLDIHFPPKRNYNRENFVPKPKPVKKTAAEKRVERYEASLANIETELPFEQFKQLEKFILSIKFQNYMATDEDIMILQLLYYVYFDIRPSGQPDKVFNKQFYRLALFYKKAKDKRDKIETIKEPSI
jgi:hypothetical protein